MSEFKQGQRVKVEYEGTVTSASASGLTLQLEVSNGERLRYVDTSRPELKVTLLDPPGWPPQVGDIWEANGMEWFARKNPYSENTFLAPVNGEDDWTQQEFKALNPVLVRRRAQ